jgi:hypothetical protein
MSAYEEEAVRRELEEWEVSTDVGRVKSNRSELIDHLAGG